jgi:hypothetical protein
VKVKLTVEQALALRRHGQALLAPGMQGEDVVLAAARQSGGLQAQDLFAAALGVRVRSAGSALADFDRSRLESKSVVWTWLMRGTLHVVPTEDLDWLLAVVGQPLIVGTAKRRAELGLDEDTYRAGLRVVRDHLTRDGPLMREELTSGLEAAGLPAGYSVERHLLFRAALEGLICFGPDRGETPGAHPTFTLLEAWLGRPLRRFDEAEQPELVACLARRYLGAFAPAALPDFSAWTGLNVRDLRAGWNQLLPELIEVDVAGQTLYAPPEALAPLDEPLQQPHVRLLPAFDTYILGHRNRKLIEDGTYTGQLKGGGILPPLVLVDGRITGTWRMNRKGRKLDIALEPFGEWDAEVRRLAEAEMRDVERFVS